MNAYALHDAGDEIWLRRWGLSVAAILAAHAAVLAVGMSWVPAPPPGVAVPAVLVDLTPITSALEISETELPPGPAMQEADASPPEPAAAQPVPQEIAPTPMQEKPDVVAPPEQKQQITPPQPEPAKVVPERKVEPVKPKVVRREAKQPSEATPAPRTSAPSRAERQAPAASAISAGAAVSAIAAYNARVRAHLLRFHSYPAGGNGQRGVVRLVFTLGRGGQVLSSHLGGSSGNPTFDARALAMVRQAQPFPAFPSEITQGSMGFSVPVAFVPR
ncbi:protein TonB [Bradyrhizobium sp. USDA 4524]|uniref:energy transducer TonB family protein n=1 Tax=unclassified Bradyrhizobium TaxID=2631580 RepID=UPI00209CED5E|nr:MULTISPECIES: energy transducer TonB [unclassified Bradyrhizobium]MCP1841686.1 protein TonB [Bradyrhizobium sp. USDA 4538]MCP1902250.1 protein TonB [Bradyrhizobium sp. USDA 4537]MCP1992092.1 protein TonB [Bradyrhizobium sp. USDA 4539]